MKLDSGKRSKLTPKIPSKLVEQVRPVQQILSPARVTHGSPEAAQILPGRPVLLVLPVLLLPVLVPVGSAIEHTDPS